MVVFMSEPPSGECTTHYDLEPRIARLVAGVAIAELLDEPPELEGTDNGLYAQLKQVAINYGETVEDRDELTKDIFTGHRKAVRVRMSWGMTMMIKQGAPLAMAKRLAHEHLHRDTESEVVAEGGAYVVCDYFGLDTSVYSFPYIAGYNGGDFTPRVLEDIQDTSARLIGDVLQVRQVE